MNRSKSTGSVSWCKRGREDVCTFRVESLECGAAREKRRARKLLLFLLCARNNSTCSIEPENPVEFTRCCGAGRENGRPKPAVGTCGGTQCWGGPRGRRYSGSKIMTLKEYRENEKIGRAARVAAESSAGCSAGCAELRLGPRQHRFSPNVLPRSPQAVNRESSLASKTPRGSTLGRPACRRGLRDSMHSTVDQSAN